MFLKLFSLIPLLHIYIGLRLLPALPWETSGVIAGALVLLASTILMPLGFLARRMPEPRADLLAWAGFFCMGVFSSLLVLTVLRDVVLLLWSSAAAVAPDAMAGQNHIGDGLARFRERSALLVLLLTAVLTMLGFINARRVAAVLKVDIPIAGLPQALHGFTIVQITDVHVGPTIKRGYLQRIVDVVNGLKADVVAVTGDLVDGSVSHLAHDVEPLAALTSRHGTFFVTGNHEYYSGVEGWVPHLRELGVNVLMNEHVVLNHGDARLVLAGITDFGAHHFYTDQQSDPVRALRGAPDTVHTRVLLAHQPRSAAAAEPAGYQLQISGHTHGGQFLPWNFLVRLQQPFTAGLAKLGKMWIYTSRGTGYWGPPKRIGAPSEITAIRLVRAEGS
jgi:predicted MPP superfamily phosphohydrolase